MKKINTTWIIDDDNIQVFLAKRILNNMGFSQNVIAMDNAKKALEELHDLANLNDSRFPDVIFLDINMPQIDGWQFLEEYDKMSLNTKVTIYLVTSSIDPMDAQKAEACDSLSGFLEKPLKTEDLQGILEKYLKQ